MQSQWFLVLSRENRKENPRASGQNKDKHRSKDEGCMQINNYWQYNKGGRWSGKYDRIYDPEFNIRVAYDIWQSWQKTKGNGWKAWYGAKGVFW